MNKKHVLWRPAPPKPATSPRVFAFAENGAVTSGEEYFGNIAFMDPNGSGIERAIFAQWRRWLEG